MAFYMAHLFIMFIHYSDIWILTLILEEYNDSRDLVVVIECSRYVPRPVRLTKILYLNRTGF